MSISPESNPVTVKTITPKRHHNTWSTLLDGAARQKAFEEFDSVKVRGVSITDILVVLVVAIGFILISGWLVKVSKTNYSFSSGILVACSNAMSGVFGILIVALFVVFFVPKSFVHRVKELQQQSI